MKNRAEKVLENIFNLSLDMICVCTPEGEIIKANPAFTRVLGYTEDEILELGWTRLIHPDDVEKTKKQVEMQLKGKPAINFVNRFRRKDGSYKILEWKATPLIDGIVYAIARDITERKKAKIALLESQRKYKDLQDASIDGHAWTDMEGHLIEVNNAYKNMMGYSEDELRNLTYKDITPDKWHAYEQKILTEQILTRGYSDPYEKELIRKDGTIFPAELRAYLIKDAQGNRKGMQAVVRDITERKTAEAKLRKAHSELELRVRERTAELQEKNIALKVLLNQREEDKNDLEQNILSNIKSLIQPYIRKLKRNNSNSEDITYLNLIESNLEDIISPFSKKLSSNYMRFTSKEVEIANLIKEGKKDKEIMEIMNIAFDTIKAHRKNIRKKLGIHGKGTNLRNKLLSM